MKLNLGSIDFYLQGSAQLIYDREVISAAVASGKGFCDGDDNNPALTDSAFNFGASSVEASFGVCNKVDLYDYCCAVESPDDQCPDSADNITKYKCSDIFQAEALGFNPQSSENSLQLSIDMNAFAIATAINLGILDLSTLERVDNDYDRLFLLSEYLSKGWINSTIYSSTYSYYDVKYAPQTPIYCTNYGRNINSCFVPVGKTLAYPITAHWGYGQTTPVDSNDDYSNNDISPDPVSSANPLQQCICSSTLSPSAIEQCNWYDIVTGLIFYGEYEQKSSKNLNHPGRIFDLAHNAAIQTSKGNDMYLTNLMYKALVSTVTRTYSKETGKYNTSYWNGVFEACDGCSLLAFEFMDPYKRDVNEFVYSLAEGSCSNSAVSETAFSSLANPPTPVPISNFIF